MRVEVDFLQEAFMLGSLLFASLLWSRNDFDFLQLGIGLQHLGKSPSAMIRPVFLMILCLLDDDLFERLVFFQEFG